MAEAATRRRERRRGGVDIAKKRNGSGLPLPSWPASTTHRFARLLGGSGGCAPFASGGDVAPLNALPGRPGPPRSRAPYRTRTRYRTPGQRAQGGVIAEL